MLGFFCSGMCSVNERKQRIGKSAPAELFKGHLIGRSEALCVSVCRERKQEREKYIISVSQLVKSPKKGWSGRDFTRAGADGGT